MRVKITEEITKKINLHLFVPQINDAIIHGPRAEGMRRIRVVRPRTLSACVLGRTHAQPTAARTDVGRSPRAFDSRARVGEPRSHARMTLSGLTSSSGRARVSLARTYLPICFAAARVLAATGGCRAHRASLSLSLSLSLLLVVIAATAWLARSRSLSLSSSRL